MLRVFAPAVRTALVASTLALVACGGSTPVVRRPAPPEERAIRAPRKPEEPPPLIAPPPAYGNKIVMARGERGTSVY